MQMAASQSVVVSQVALDTSSTRASHGMNSSGFHRVVHPGTTGYRQPRVMSSCQMFFRLRSAGCRLNLRTMQLRQETGSVRCTTGILLIRGVMM